MILIDAMYINNSGGKVLLDYLIKELQKTDKEVFYLLDKRVEGAVPDLTSGNSQVVYLKASLLNRHRFYFRNKGKFDSVLCFGGLPPSLKLSARVYTYFHQQLYLQFPDTFPVKDRLIFILKRMVLKFLFRNSDYWMLQTTLIRDNFKKKFDCDEEKLFLMPFFPRMNKVENVVRKKNSYVFISKAPPHKNHVRLINAFCEFFDKHQIGELTITVDSAFPELIKMIEERVNLKYPIKNIGFIDRDKLSEVYQSNEYLIFPSLAESLGLGIAEAIECGCKVIGADLPYMYAVCKPSLVFNPLDEESILDAFEESIRGYVQPSICLVHNKINQLVELL
ncbi:glycosyltransferase [Sphingobacterium sp.]|uniref:glycosyltransferase n=1 Tax=Sphingobacterium sp. TaxID=341027 RepID=UPI002898F02C|nr:glycosyltransferase [Sphingobacterium sp.]